MKSIKEVEQYFTKEELDYLLPLLKKWSKNDSEILDWFNTHQLASCGKQTPSTLCKEGRKYHLIQYIKHIELGGFT